MKIKSLTLRSYKKFLQKKTFYFTENQKKNCEINDVTLIVGNNGTGKSSILQAIAMVVGGASRPFFSPVQLDEDFPGFQYKHIHSGKTALDISASMTFLPDEIEATIEYTKRLQDLHPERQLELPKAKTEIALRLDYENNKILSDDSRQFFQARGYQYALQLRNVTPNANALLDRVGTIHWYTEQRNLSSTFQPVHDDNTATKVKNILFGNDDKPSIKMKDLLIAWARFDQDIQNKRIVIREGQSNKYERLANLYKVIFPSRSLSGPAPKDSPDNYEVEDFFLFDGKAEYELGSMSGGERAIFPILVDFANWNINNSIILIDELELHLHPPLQQTLVRALPKLGRNNQFIITTHSDSVSTMFSPDKIIRLQ